MIKLKDTRIKLPLKHKQYILAGSVAVVLIGAGSLFCYTILSSPSEVQQASAKKEVQIESGSSRINPQEIWVNRIESESRIRDKRLDTLEQMLMNFATENQKSQQPNPDDINTIKEHIKALEEKLSQEVQSESLQGKETNKKIAKNSSSDFVPLLSSGGRELKEAGVKKIVLNLVESKDGKFKKTVDNTIPAGAFAKAVLLGGVDASTSIQASADPRPVLLRLVDKGTLPRKFKSDLKDCHVLASCYGDLSSERVFMRLEKLTCTEVETGEISETQVTGYIAGEDGKAGVRGVVADRSGEAMRNSLIGGFLGGMGGFLTQVNQPITFGPTAPLGQVNPLTNPEMLKAGAGKGVQNALEKYADFYIKRAEQLQPILQVSAGRLVDIVFTQGTFIGGTQARSEISKAREQARMEFFKDASPRDASHGESSLNDPGSSSGNPPPFLNTATNGDAKE